MLQRQYCDKLVKVIIFDISKRSYQGAYGRGGGGRLSFRCTSEFDWENKDCR